MPTPLFPFVWQYSNQPIEVLAQDVSGLIVNTSTYIPLSDGTNFVDSSLLDAGTYLTSQYLGVNTGLQMNYIGRKYAYGDNTTNYSQLVIDDPSGTVDLSSSKNGPVVSLGVDSDNETLTAVGVTDVTAGAAAALFLKITVDGNPYKIQLLDIV